MLKKDMLKQVTKVQGKLRLGELTLRYAEQNKLKDEEVDKFISTFGTLLRECIDELQDIIGKDEK